MRMHQTQLSTEFILSQLDKHWRVYVDIDNVCWATAKTAMTQFGIEEWPVGIYDMGVNWAMLHWHKVPVIVEPPIHPRVFLVTSIPTCHDEMIAKVDWVRGRPIIFTQARHLIGTDEDLLIDDYEGNISKWPGEAIHIEWRGNL